MNRLLTKSVLSRVPMTFCRLAAIRFSSAAGSKENLEKLVQNNKVVVFMKGTPDAPRCGFSNAVVQILNFHGVDDYDAHNVLADEDLRQGVKEFSNWPTIPQVYMNGEFIGGCDILLDMHKNGELIEELQKVGIRSQLLDHPDKQA
ncbi:glutaredoxin-related protein 5, mitochondrial-like [Haliotis cracherodii]|uniref:glutaredoxin-related protein 5, mitochondrial-like n=1 Tax=Haliotis rufescens TaxID=6454 RepID=UPI001EB0488A|nr:glutaredoxin-related protein 5, mitochondrial-like [Haliotis rufescens]